MTHRMGSRPEFVKSFYDVSNYYQNITVSIFNMTKKPRKFLKTAAYLSSTSLNVTTKWIKYLSNSTSRVFDTAESIVNGSLVNQTINNLTVQSVRSCSQLMKFDVVNFTSNYTDWMLNQTLENIFNTSKIPFYSTWKTLNKVYQMEARELAMLFTPKSKSKVQTSYI
jgi:hypothetical protein